MNIGTAFASKYLKASDIPEDHPVTVRIDRVEIEDLGQGQDKDSKPILYFVGKNKGMVLNKTNSKVIAKAYGEETDDWTGKPVTIMSMEVEFKGDMVQGLRIRIPKAPVNGGGQGAPVRVAAPAPSADISTMRQQIRDRAPAQAPFDDAAQEFTEDSISF